MTDIPIAELRTCPFCGKANARTLPALRRVLCMTPDCDAEMAGSTQAEAIKRWNTRTPDPVLKECVEALEFYANPEIYKPHPHGPAFDKRDVSFKAVATLAAMTKGEE